MTDLYQYEQQTKQQSQTNLPAHTSILTNTNMPSFYPATRHRSFISKHLTDHDDDDDPDSIYKEAFIVQIFQHWKLKTLEHQQALHNPENITTSNDFLQPPPINTSVPVELSTNEITPIEISSSDNKDEVPNVNESLKPNGPTMQKRAIPLVTTQTRRHTAFKKSFSTPADSSNPNLLTPHAKTKSGPTVTITTAKKPTKPAPIFIAPKKSQPPSQPRSYAWLSTEESLQAKRKGTVEKPNLLSVDLNSIPISPAWAPAPPTTPTRFFSQSPGTSFDDDETSGDENNHESLLIRNKRLFKKPTQTKEKHPLSIPSNLIIPTAICVTDPHGHSRVFDFSSDWMDEFANSKRIVENDFLASTSYNSNNIDENSLPCPILPMTSSSSSSSPSPNSLDKYPLHSIGEEEEEDQYEQRNSLEKENQDSIILSKELDRIEAYSRSRQTNVNVEKKDFDQNSTKNRKVQLERRWSDSFVSDDEDHLQSQQSSLIKMASATSIIKPPPAKLSKTKYLLMKLHLAPSPIKDDDSNISATSNLTNPPPRKRTVRRSTDKKRYQTR
uniref:PKD channel n=1 Tax=Adineta vaga TaxID=104782 RepID=B3G3Z0_ADIVA|nr:PKD channel [Adineta vaga]